MIRISDHIPSSALLRCLSFIVLLIVAAAHQAHSHDQEYLVATITAGIDRTPHLKSVDVADLLAYNRIIEPHALPGVKPVFNISPDGNFAIVATQQGDATKRTLTYTLYLIDLKKTRQYVTGNLGANSAPLKKLMNWEVSDSMRYFGRLMRPPLLNGFVWSKDSQRIYFLGKEDGKPDQVYVVSIASGKIQQLTQRDRPVIAYYANEDANRLVGYELADVDVGQTGEAHAVRADVKSMMEVACYRCDPYSTQSSMPQMFAQNLDSTEARVIISSSRISLDSSKFWMSPDGKKAIVAAYPSINKQWESTYGSQIIHPNSGRDMKELRYAHLYMDQRMRPILQYFIVDIETGTMNEIVDAPTKMDFVGVLWSPDSKRALLAGTYLPPTTGNQVTDQERRKWPFIAEYAIDAQVVRPIYALMGSNTDPVNGMWPDLIQIFHDKTLIIARRGANGRQPKSIAIRWARNTWSIMEDEERSFDGDLEFTVRESFNSPPEIVGRIRGSGQERVLTDFNPQIRQLALTRTEEIEWRDEQNLVWRGALIFPEDYAPEKRYPLVLEVRGYTPGGFVFGGQGRRTAPFVGRALASKGIMVLQMPAVPIWARASEIGDMLEIGKRGIAAAVRHLVDIGYADPSTIGVTGWSASGAFVMDSLVFSEPRFAAAVIADAMGIGMVNYANLFGFIPPGMNYSEQMLQGAQPWGSKLQDWVKRNPVFHLDKVDTPLLIHGYVPGAVIGWWDFYAILRRLGKPVEMWQYFEADHAPIKPQIFLHASQMVVDWYSFWLKDKPPANENSDQYARWVEMKHYREQSKQPPALARQGRDGRNDEIPAHVAK